MQCSLTHSFTPLTLTYHAPSPPPAQVVRRWNAPVDAVYTSEVAKSKVDAPDRCDHPPGPLRPPSRHQRSTHGGKETDTGE